MREPGSGAEAEQGRFPLVRDEVVDLDASVDRRRRRHSGETVICAVADLRSGGQVRAFGFEARQVALRRRLRVDAEADRQVDPHVLEDPDRFFVRPAPVVCLTMNWVKPTAGARRPGCRTRRRSLSASRSARRCAGARLPAVVRRSAGCSAGR